MLRMQHFNKTKMTLSTFCSEVIYVSNVHYLAKFYNKSPDKINREDVKKYLYHLQVNRKLSSNTLNVAHCAIRFFYTNVINAEWVVRGITKFKRDKSKPLVLNKTEVEAILNLTWNIKHKTILTLIYSAGLRVSEAATLKVNHIDTERMQIYIKDAKGSVDRYAILFIL